MHSIVCGGGRHFQSPELVARKQSWKEGQPPALLCRQTFMGCLLGAVSKTSALQLSVAAGESCWSHVNLRMGSVGSCQVDICGSVIHSRQGWGMQERKWGEKLYVWSTRCQWLSWAIYTHIFSFNLHSNPKKY